MRVFLPRLDSVDKNAARELARMHDQEYTEAKFELDWAEFIKRKSSMKKPDILSPEVQKERDRCVTLLKETHRYLNGLIEVASATDRPGLLRARVMLIGLATGIAEGATERVSFSVASREHDTDG